MTKPTWKCRVCGGTSYTGPFSTTLYECDDCSAVFGDPKKFGESQESVCAHEWHTYTGGMQCLRCGAHTAIGTT